LLAIHKSEPFENINVTKHIRFPCKNPKPKEQQKNNIAKDYINDVQKKIQSNWNPPQYKSSYNIGVKFKIDKDGKAYDKRIALSSGNPDIDLMGIKAIENSSPFTQPPISLFNQGDDGIDIDFTFDYNKQENPVAKKIKSNLFFPVNFKQSDKTALIDFDIQPQGNVTNLVITENDVNKAVINQCLFAIHKSEPFENINVTKHIQFPCKNPKPKEQQKSNIAKDYIKDVQKKIKSNWHPPQYKSPYRIGLKFKIDRNGRAYDKQIALSSGNPDNDLMGIKAIENSSPFVPPPISLFDQGYDSIDIDFTLDYNVRTRSNTFDKVGLGLDILDLFTD
jgi:outer membrane biosynthesis protein TonB